MKEKFKDFMTSPPVIALFVVAVYALISPLFSHPAERMSVSTFMEYHTVEELADYWNLNGEAGYVAEILTEEFEEEFFIENLYDAGALDTLLDEAYNEGYNDGYNDR